MKPTGSADSAASDWIRTGTLWVARWAVILPVNWLFSSLLGEHGTPANLAGDPLIVFLLAVIASPLLETAIECLLPYTVLQRIQRSSPRTAFVIVSAALMALLHFVSVVAVANAAITGAFIAYVYAAAASRRGQSRAFLHAFTFHAAINLVGWVLYLVNIGA
jgi:hypothetical protein